MHCLSPRNLSWQYLEHWRCTHPLHAALPRLLPPPSVGAHRGTVHVDPFQRGRPPRAGGNANGLWRASNSSRQQLCHAFGEFGHVVVVNPEPPEGTCAPDVWETTEAVPVHSDDVARGREQLFGQRRHAVVADGEVPRLAAARTDLDTDEMLLLSRNNSRVCLLLQLRPGRPPRGCWRVSSLDVCLPKLLGTSRIRLYSTSRIRRWAAPRTGQVQVLEALPDPPAARPWRASPAGSA